MKHNLLIRFICTGCQCESTGHRHYINGLPYCKKCSSFLENERKLIESFKKGQLIKSVRERYKSCRVLGTCAILRMHHEILKNDPERLSTDFLVNLICGEEKAKEYRQKSSENSIAEYFQNLF